MKHRTVGEAQSGGPHVRGEEASKPIDLGPRRTVATPSIGDCARLGVAPSVDDHAGLGRSQFHAIGCGEGRPSSYLRPASRSSSLGAAVQQVRLTASDGYSGDDFGYSVAVSGDTAVVGADVANTAVGPERGAAYVFVRSGDTWTEQAKLIAPDGAALDHFGWSVALSGDTAVVGAVQHANVASNTWGAAYVFVRSGTVWTQQAELSHGPAGSNAFANSVALIGDTLVVGAPYFESEGRAYVYVRAETTWTQQAELKAPDRAAGDSFGSSVALNGNTAVVGADGDDTPGGTDAGSAYVYVRFGTAWIRQAKLTASDGAADDLFGNSVAVNGNTAVVGAIFGHSHSSLRLKSGAAYVFVRSGGTWTQQAKLRPSDVGYQDRFGFSTAVIGDIAVVGAPLHDTDQSTGTGSDTGSAYMFVRSGSTWTQQAKLIAAAGSGDYLFGISVAMTGNTAVVGSENDAEENEQPGSAYVYWRSSPA